VLLVVGFLRLAHLFCGADPSFRSADLLRHHREYTASVDTDRWHRGEERRSPYESGLLCLAIFLMTGRSGPPG
jgi:hypothetical protein